MSSLYNPFDWYWLAEDGTLYGSAAGARVAPDDPAYVAWCAVGRMPTLWPVDDHGAQTDAALQAVLTPYGLTLPPAA